MMWKFQYTKAKLLSTIRSNYCEFNFIPRPKVLRANNSHENVDE